MADDLLPTADAAELAGVAYTTFSHWVQVGHVRPVERRKRPGPGGSPVAYFRRADVLAAAEAVRKRRNRGCCRTPEPTEAELDAMIAERMKSLPAWWWKEPGEPTGPAEEAPLVLAMRLRRRINARG